VIDRDNRENWLKAGGQDTYERAVGEVDRRLAAYEPVPTDPLVEEELRAIIRSGLRDQTELPVIPAAPEPVRADPSAGRRRNLRRGG